MDKETETPQEKFNRIARYRTKKVMEDLRLLSNLGKPYYKSTPEQRRKIVATVRKGVEDLEYILEGEEAASGSFKTDI